MTPEPVLTADVVVVGAGSAGCVVAGRLSEDRDRTVALVEAGSDAGHSGPLGVLPVGPASETVWRYPAHLRDGAAAVDLVRGRLLGGSGAVNGGYFVRATADDFARWPASWSYGSVLPYFRRLESDPFGERRWHGDDGPMPVTRTAVGDLHPVSAAFLAAAVDAGFEYRADLNEPDAIGVGPVPLNARAGTRVSTAGAYLVPHLARPNLRVLSGVVARRVLVAGTRTVGVEVESAGRRRLLRAGAVVVSAGAVGTPHLLMCSGIGAAQHLSRLGIGVVVDLPGVGQGFGDHPEVTVGYRLSAASPHTRDRAVLEAVLETGDLELRPYRVPFGRAIAGVDDDLYRIGVALMRPRSRGEIVLRSADPAVPPSVHHGYLRERADREALLDGLGLAADLLGGPARAGLVEPITPGAVTLDHLGTSMHLSGSCAMGSPDDPLAVVDEHCRVIGVDGLWVSDGSVMPAVPSRGPHATTVMIGERVAEFVAILDG